MTAEQATFGDFGGPGLPSGARDHELDRQAAAKQAASGEWEFLAVGSDTIGWHIPETPATLLVTPDHDGWVLERAGRQLGPRRDSLRRALEHARAYMADNPAGGRS